LLAAKHQISLTRSAHQLQIGHSPASLIPKRFAGIAARRQQERELVLVLSCRHERRGLSEVGENLRMDIPFAGRGGGEFHLGHVRNRKVIS